jgi:hypothetical protein
MNERGIVTKKKYVVLVTTRRKKGRYQIGITVSPLWKWKMETGRQITQRLKMVNPWRDTVKKTERMTTQFYEVVSSR